MLVAGRKRNKGVDDEGEEDKDTQMMMKEKILEE